MIVRSGLHGLFRLGGGAIDPVDAAAWAMPFGDQPGPALAHGRDIGAAWMIHRSDADGQLTILAGHIDDAEILAGRLKLRSSIGKADLARATLQRFGATAPVEMLGEWTLLHWEPEGRLTLMSSAARRDRLFYAVAGNRCAISSDLFRLTRLPWVGRNIDAAGLLFQMGRASLRSRAGSSTMLDGVRQLQPAASVVITPGGVETRQADALTPQPRWRGTFEDACEAAEELLLCAVRDRIDGSGSPAVLLSGGLDSSLLAWAAAEGLSAEQHLHLLTSVAPPGSGLPDESAYAGTTAAALGLSCVPVYPAADGNPYRPSRHLLESADGVLLSNRQPLSDAFQRIARQQGATVLLNGTYGEYTLTGSPFFPTWRNRARRLLNRLAAQNARTEAGDAFHVRLSSHRLARLPEEIVAALDAPPDGPVADRRPGDDWGYHPGVERALGQANEYHAGALRMEFPFRDVRLLRLFAGMPNSFFSRSGYDRAFVRRIAIGRLPDSIRLRRRGMPASPDHLTRLQAYAATARGRIDAFRSADIDEWLDLGWLDTTLRQIAEGGASGMGDGTRAQLTAMTAELLTWWRTGD